MVVTIHTPSEVWMAMSHGEMAGAAALMTGKYCVEGDLGLLMRGQVPSTAATIGDIP